MNINEDYESNSVINATDAMDHSMAFIFDNFIEPMEKELSEDQAFMLAVIGSTFKIIAQKAQAYEDMIEGNQNDIQRN
tara:strand:+ start:97 stop:330 length:234 start_codon:yes stop_codon:yes gene_type:complete